MRTELVQEEDAANEVVDLRQKLDCAVQEKLRKHGINVQRYWNGAVCVCVFLARKSLTSNAHLEFISARRSRLQALPHSICCDFK